jgi:hypothetical protein
VRRLVIVLVAVLAGLAFLPGIAAPALAQATDPATAEAEFVSRINELRRSKGLGTLTVHDELVHVARGWAAKMAEADEISHNPDLADSVSADWQKLGENVGVGMTVAKLHDAFVRSPAHYRNLVDPDFTHIGVAVVLGRDGAIFTTHQFMKLRAPKPPATTTTTALELVASARPAPSPAPAPATDAAEVAAPAPVQPSTRLVLVLEQLRQLDRT